MAGTEKRKNMPVTLTGDRIVEVDICRAMLAATGIPVEELTGQKVLSAALQTLMAHLNAGMKIAWEFDDARHRNNRWAESNKN